MLTSLPSTKIILRGLTEPLDIQVSDDDGTPVEVDGLKIDIIDLGGNVRWSDDIANNPTAIVSEPNNTLGYYFYPFGPLPGQTDSYSEFLARWTITVQGIPPLSVTQNIKIISPTLMYTLPYLRLLIDKSRKYVDVENDVFLGYTDEQLVMFMEGGMQIINTYQPGNIGFTIDNFPWPEFRHIALESALMSGVISQQLFAIDTDIPQYSDQGTNFIIAHQPQLAAFLNQIIQRLDKAIPMMKLQFITTGSIRVEAGPNFRLAQLLQAAPNGALFRNMFVGGR